jgi:glycosyltransferase involved in cell wall biosynthesis
LKIVINTAHQRFGGAIQVALSFIYECRKFHENEYHIWVGPGVKQSLKPEDFPDNFHFSFFDFGIISLKKTFQINRTLQREESRLQPDVIIATSGPTYFHAKFAPQIIGFNLPLYIYSESPYVQELDGFARLRMSIKKKFHFYFFRRDAAAYVVQTDDVNQRVRKALRTDSVYTVTNTHSANYQDWQRLPDRLPPRKPGCIRMITISAFYPHKNLDLIPRVLQQLRADGYDQVDFVVTLNEQDFRQHFEPDPNIINLGPVPPAECPSLYEECDMLFLPTLAECFSASYPEAMAMGKPIITTDLGFARSICGEAAVYFVPKDAASAARQIEKLLEDDHLRRKLICKGKERLKKFDTAEVRAEKYLDLCSKLVTNTTDTV